MGAQRYTAAVALLVIMATAASASRATWYYVNNPQEGDDHDSIGACGDPISNDDFVGALGFDEFGGGENPNDAPICGTSYNVFAPNGRAIVVKILDKCRACEPGHIDLTPAAFQALQYDLDQGNIEGATYGPA